MNPTHLRNIPPHVMRELRRHVNPSNKHMNNAGSSKPRDKSKQLHWVLAGTIALTGTAATFPLLAHWWIGNLNAKEEPLKAPQVRRGAFNNSGTRDVGRDPDWDFATGQHKYQSGYQAVYQEERASLPGEYHAVHPDKIKEYEHKLESFAKGKGKNN